MEFRTVEIANHIIPEFEGDNAEAWLRSSFLRDTEGFAEELLDIIRRAASGEVSPNGTPLGWSHNEMSVDCYQDRVAITHYYLYDEAGVELEIAIPRDEAIALLTSSKREVEAFQNAKRNRAY